MQCDHSDVDVSGSRGADEDESGFGRGERERVRDRAVLAVMLLGTLALMLSGTFAPGFAAATELVQPHSLIVAGTLPKAQDDAQILPARRYDTSWSTGDEALARAALAHDFTDRT